MAPAALFFLGGQGLSGSLGLRQCWLGFMSAEEILSNPQLLGLAKALRVEKANLYWTYLLILVKLNHFPFQSERS